MFDLPIVFDTAATCRQALSAHPSDRALIIAENNASLSLSLITRGVGFPDSDEEAVLQALRDAENKCNLSRLEVEALGFYLGSAYEYGVGARHDRTEAAKWYAMAAQAGDPISKRELARLQSARP
jgi:TPR repeat protein